MTTDCSSADRKEFEGSQTSEKMMAEEEEKSLEDTPTWAVAAVCAVFVVVSLMVERGLKYLGRVRIASRHQSTSRFSFFFFTSSLVLDLLRG